MLRQGVWCRSTWFTLGVGSDIRLRSSRSLWTDTSSTPAVQEPMRVIEQIFDDTPRGGTTDARGQLRRGSRRPTP